MPTRPRIRFAALGVGSLSMLTFCAAARGQVFFYQPPFQTGGPASDTEFIDLFGIHTWSLEADDVRLFMPATLQRIRYWGFYHEDNPPLSETMRIRIYDARPADGLPGNILREQSFLNPQRLSTGRTVFSDVDAREFEYQVDLAAPFPLAADTPYWLEIVQIGDISTTFRWESSWGAGHVHAFETDYAPNWRYSAGSFALELSSVPEPGAVLLLCVGVFMIRKELK